MVQTNNDCRFRIFISSSSHSSLTSCTSYTTLRAVATLRTSPQKKMDSTDESYLLTGYEPKSYDLKETSVKSFTESLTHPQFSEQRFLEDVDYDDAALEEMLHNAHRVHVYHSRREGLSVGQSSSSVSERTGRPVEERTGRPVLVSGQELNVGNAQIRTLLDRQKEQILAECQAEIKKQEFQANYDRRSVRKLVKLLSLSRKNFIEFKQKNFNDEINHFFMHSYYSKIGIFVKLMRTVSKKWKN